MYLLLNSTAILWLTIVPAYFGTAFFYRLHVFQHMRPCLVFRPLLLLLLLLASKWSASHIPGYFFSRKYTKWERDSIKVNGAKQHLSFWKEGKNNRRNYIHIKHLCLFLKKSNGSFLFVLCGLKGRKRAVSVPSSTSCRWQQEEHILFIRWSPVRSLVTVKIL